MEQATAGKRINNFLQAIRDFQEGVDFSTIWPANPLQVEPYYDSLLAVSLHQKFKRDKVKFAKALQQVPPDLIRQLLYSGCGQIGLKIARRYEHYPISLEEITELTLALFDTIKSRVHSDEFCRDGENRLLAPEQAETKLGNQMLIPTPP